MTEWKVLHKPSRNMEAIILTKWQAIDITYQCPNCGADRATTWLFPDEGVEYVDECCNRLVMFEPEEGVEEE